MDDGESRSIGGFKVPASVLTEAIGHMQAYVHLVRHCLKAEFPNFSLINSFSAFELPNAKPRSAATIFTPEMERQVKRIGVIFKQPHLLQQFKSRWHYAFLLLRTKPS